MRNETGVESNTDSIIEHKKEIISARNRYIKSSVIFSSNIKFNFDKYVEC